MFVIRGALGVLRETFGISLNIVPGLGQGDKMTVADEPLRGRLWILQLSSISSETLVVLEDA
jgi:hypothetical protein